MAKTKPGEKALVHLLVRNDASGPIKSQIMGGPDSGKPIGFHVACTPTSKIPEFATGEVGSVNCPLCKATPEFEALSIAEENGNGSEADLAAARAMTAAVDTAEGAVDTAEGCEAC
jgi:hypothetical protein